MKNYFILSFLLLLGFGSMAQVKVGFVDSQRLLDTMPSRKAAEAKYTAYEKEAVDEFTLMQEEFDKAVAIYQKELPTYTPVIKEAKERKLMEKEQSLNAREQTLSQELQAYSSELNAPILEKVQQAVKIVAQRKALSYVTDKSTTLYHDTLLDITKEVAVELLKLDKVQ